MRALPSLALSQDNTPWRSGKITRNVRFLRFKVSLPRLLFESSPPSCCRCHHALYGHTLRPARRCGSFFAHTNTCQTCPSGSQPRPLSDGSQATYVRTYVCTYTYIFSTRPNFETTLVHQPSAWRTFACLGRPYRHPGHVRLTLSSRCAHAYVRT